MSIRFPYHYKQIEFGKIVDPTIRLQVLTPFGWREFKFLVDSGADVTTLPLSALEFFGTEIDKRKKTLVGGVEGRGVYGYPSKIKIKIGEEELDVRCYFIESETIPLLGRTDVFDRFSIIFDNERSEVEFRRLEEKKCFLARLIK